MIGIDTNVLVRYLTQDDPVQSSRATRLIEGQLTERNPGYVTTVVLAETVWVLRRGYRFTTAEVASAIERILQVDALVVELDQEVFLVLTALRNGIASFPDALIAALCRRAGCSRVATFDQRASTTLGFMLV